MLDRGEIQSLPKVMLHDHLDGGVRPETIVDLAQEIGYKDLPSNDPVELGSWILSNSKRATLVLYLESFIHTLAVMQKPAGIERIAYECGEDLAKDGVVYAEIRFAPELMREEGLEFEDVMGAVVAGFDRATADYGIQLRILCSGMKQFQNSADIAKLAVTWKEKGVVGFDMAGPEDGFLSSEHLEAIEIAKAGGLRLTLHAGEAAGLESIADALDPCGAERLGHGVRIMDDIDTSRLASRPNGVENISMGPLAERILSEQIPLEVCPTSNIHTGIADSFSAHPLKTLLEAGFLVTLNTDNRLMSQITLTEEFLNCQESYNWTASHFHQLTLNAMNSAFCTEAEKQELIQEIINPAYSQI